MVAKAKKYILSSNQFEQKFLLIYFSSSGTWLQCC